MEIERVREAYWDQILGAAILDVAQIQACCESLTYPADRPESPVRHSDTTVHQLRGTDREAPRQPTTVDDLLGLASVKPGRDWAVLRHLGRGIMASERPSPA